MARPNTVTASYLVSPTEHQLHAHWRSNGFAFRVSSLPERYGTDIVVLNAAGAIGFQRKSLSDLQASLHDGRLYRELAQINSTGDLSEAFLIVEGEIKRTTDGGILNEGLSIDGIRSVIAKCHSCGVGHIPTISVADTARAIVSVAHYLSKGDASRLRRVKMVGDGWGRANSRQYAIYLMQSFPNIGPKQAEAILDHFGKVPFTWTVTEKELTEVPGIGPKIARSLYKALNP